MAIRIVVVALVFAIPACSAMPVVVGQRGQKIEIVLPRAGDRSRPAEFITGLASSRLLPGARVREARRGEGARISARFRVQDFPLVPQALRILDAIGLDEIELHAFRDGDLIRAVASVRLDPAAPAPPLANTRLTPPAMRDGDWATAAIFLDAVRIVPWAVGVAGRVDKFQGQMLADALVVAKWNLGLDVEKDVAGALVGGVRALASREFGDSAALVADMRSRHSLAKALRALAVASRLVPRAVVALEPARFGETDGYRVRTPYAGVAPSVALLKEALIVSTSPDLDGLPSRLSAAARDDIPRSLARVGGPEVCAVGVVNVLECIRAARAFARAGGIDQSRIPTPASLAWADGEVAVVVRVGGSRLQVWAAWQPSRSDLAVPADDTVAQSHSNP